MLQPLLAPSPPLAGRLLLSASVLELPLMMLLLLPPLLLVHCLPELQHALPTCHHAEKNISFTPKIHVTSSHGEPQAFTITVKSLGLGVKYLQLFSERQICLSRRECGANVRAGITSFSKCSNIYWGIVLAEYRCQDMSEATYEA